MNDRAWDWAWHCRGLTPTQRLVLLALAEQAGEDGETCLPPLRRLERMTGLSRRGIAKTLHALEATGWIARERAEYDGATAYRLLLDGAGSASESSGNDREGGAKRES
ncbi:MAG: helix-turn-helix domain-containing protein [Chromatiaceae bacterium]|jgi:DNA-binding MarR family transcriptional regulator